jgi:hypothetical protein
MVRPSSSRSKVKSHLGVNQHETVSSKTIESSNISIATKNLISRVIDDPHPNLPNKENETIEATGGETAENQDDNLNLINQL